jgi:hypothetical protein
MNIPNRNPITETVTKLLPSLQKMHSINPALMPLVFAGRKKVIRKLLRRLKIPAHYPKDVTLHSFTCAVPKQEAQKFLMGCANGGTRCAERLDTEKEGRFWAVVTYDDVSGVINLPKTGDSLVFRHL